jgi:hypothetical protein
LRECGGGGGGGRGGGAPLQEPGVDCRGRFAVVCVDSDRGPRLKECKKLIISKMCDQGD